MKRLLLLGSLLFATPVAAQSYLTPSQVDLTTLLPPPPATGSTADRTDMDAVLGLQATRTAEQVSATAHDADETALAEFGAVLGPRFDPKALPLTVALFDRIHVTADGLVAPAKQAFGRKRPAQANPEVHPSTPPGDGQSYPSQHAAAVTVGAIVLSAMLPERRTEIFDRAAVYARNRVVAGVQYPTDTLAGQRAGTGIAAVLLQDAAFQSQFGPAKAELRKAMGAE